MIAGRTLTTLRRVHKPRRKSAGLTLIESALLISVVGVVAAVSIPTFVRSLELSKFSEASHQLASLHAAAAAYYAERRDIGGARVHCLPEAAGPTPAKPTVQPTRTDFAAVPAWQAIGFAPTEELRFRYSYVPEPAGCHSTAQLPSPAPSFTLRAEGDLDGDGAYSTFERTAHATAPGQLVSGPVMRIRDRVE